MTPRTIGLLVALGTVLAQAAWVLAVPPFRGIDEFQHVYRAASVAGGAWAPNRLPDVRGRGGIVTVPHDIVAAARAQCTSLPATVYSDCNPIVLRPDGTVTVVSAATKQSPAFYGLLGWAARPFAGASADYAMRLVASLLCAMTVGAAAWAVSTWARSRWPLFALLAALTPVTIYSTSLPAPNGLEMVSGLAVWACLLGLTGDVSRQVRGRLLLAALPPAVLLVSLRQLGPLFLLLIVGTVAVLAGGRRTWEVLRGHPRLVSVVAGAVGAATALHVWWMLSAGYAEPRQAWDPPTVAEYPRKLLLWFLQSLATGAYRDQPAPVVVYAAMAVVVVGLLWAGARAARTAAERRGLTVAVGVAVAVPVVFTVLTYHQRGDFWQGRYGMALTGGVLLACGLLLDRAPLRSRTVLRAMVPGTALLVLAHVASPLGLLNAERERDVSVHQSGWVMPPSAVVVVLVLLAWGLYAAALRGAGEASDE